MGRAVRRLREEGLGLREEPLGFREKPLGFREEPLGFREEPLGFREKPLGFRGEPLGLREKPLGFREEPLGFREKPLGFREVIWCDADIERIVALGTAVEDLRGGDLKFATDFRPHSHHYEMMKQVRANRTESGVLEIGNARVCGFMTTWGDGFFPVHLDLDTEQRPVALRIELGTDTAVAHMDAVNGR